MFVQISTGNMTIRTIYSSTVTVESSMNQTIRMRGLPLLRSDDRASESSMPQWSSVARENTIHEELLLLNSRMALKLLPHPFGLTWLQKLFPFPHLYRLRDCPRALISKETFLLHPACDFSVLWLRVFVNQACS